MGTQAPSSAHIVGEGWCRYGAESRHARISATRQEAAFCTAGGLTQKETVGPTQFATASGLSETSGDDFLLGSAPCLRATSVVVRARAMLSRDVRTSPTRQESPTAAICTEGGLTQKGTVVPTRCATASRLSETSGDDFL